MHDVEPSNTNHSPPPSWSTIPNKGQLALICSIRVADFFQQAALQAFMFYQLQSFSPDATDSEISFQTGVLQGVFTSVQIFTGVIWGRVADLPSFGRKKVVLISLIGQSISCIGVGFSSSFYGAVVWRGLGGAVNATVSGARTALSEATEKKFHSRTFLLLPLAWNIANIIAPTLGGLLSDPVTNFPTLFAEKSIFGGDHGVVWLKKYPYAAPNLLCALILVIDALLLWLFFRETLPLTRNLRDRGLELGEKLRKWFVISCFQKSEYTQISQTDTEHCGSVEHESNSSDTVLVPLSLDSPSSRARQTVNFEVRGHSPVPPFHHVFTKNVALVLAAVAVMDFQLSGFITLWTVFLASSPRNQNEEEAVRLPFHFAGGLGFSPSAVGVAMSMIGTFGIVIQLSIYPRINARLGLLRSTRYSLFVFPLAYAVAPYLSLLRKVPILLWPTIVLVVILHIGGRTFAMPGLVLLTNNSTPDPALLGTIHGLGATVSSASRTIGPSVTSHWYGKGLEKGMVGYAWWLLTLISIIGIVPSFWTKDGK